MTPEANKSVVTRFIDEVFLGGDFEAVDELCSDDFTAHTWGPGPTGVAELKAAIERVNAGLSDATMRVDDMVAEDDRVVVRLTASATQTGPFMGIQATGKRYEIGEIHWFRLQDGRIAEHWHQADFLGMLRQLGAMPQPGGSPGGGSGGASATAETTSAG
jgi:steroid delta-isomerase-like uncharacterized protein